MSSAARKCRASGGGVAEAALDHPAVEELQRVLGPEPKGAHGVRAAPLAQRPFGRGPTPGRPPPRCSSARRSASRARERASPTSTSRSRSTRAVSSSVRAPFASNSRCMASTSSYASPASAVPAGGRERLAEARRRTRAAAPPRAPAGRGRRLRRCRRAPPRRAPGPPGRGGSPESGRAPRGTRALRGAVARCCSRGCRARRAPTPQALTSQAGGRHGQLHRVDRAPSTRPSSSRAYATRAYERDRGLEGGHAVEGGEGRRRSRRTRASRRRGSRAPERSTG